MTLRSWEGDSAGPFRSGAKADLLYRLEDVRRDYRHADHASQARVTGVSSAGDDHGFSTTFTQLSVLSRNMRNARGASSSGSVCVMTKLGSISPFCTRSSSGRR